MVHCRSAEISHNALLSLGCPHQLINEKPQVINEYESGRAIPNPTVLSKLDRALGVRLPRAAKKK